MIKKSPQWNFLFFEIPRGKPLDENRFMESTLYPHILHELHEQKFIDIISTQT